MNLEIDKLIRLFEQYSGLSFQAINKFHLVVLFLILLLAFSNIAIGLIFSINMAVDSTKTNDLRSVLNKDSVDYVVVTEIPSKPCFKDIIKCFTMGKYPFILFFMISTLLSVIALSYAAYITYYGVGGIQTKMFAWSVALYGVLAASMTTAYMSSIRKPKITDQAKKYEEFNQLCQNYTLFSQLEAIKELAVSPTNLWEREAVIEAALNKIQTLDVNKGDHYRILFTLNMFLQYCKIADEDQRAEALQYYFDKRSFFVTSITKRPLEWSKYLYRDSNTIQNFTQYLVKRYKTHKAFAQLSAQSMEEAKSRVSGYIAELNKITAGWAPERTYKQLNQLSTGVFVVQTVFIMIYIYVLKKLRILILFSISLF